jgi:hypothetical protein
MQTSKETGQTLFSFLPGAGVAEYWWFRLHYYFSRHVSSPPEYCGVQINSGQGFASWTCEFRPGFRRTLIITRLRASEETVEGLMLLVLNYAKACGLDAIETWNLPENLARALHRLLGTKVERDKYLPAMKWYGSDSRVGWMVNERFCWC